MITSNKKSLYLLLIIFLNSCGVPRFYNEINEMHKSVKHETENVDNDAINIKIKDFNMNLLVFNKLKKELTEVNHIIYFYHPKSSFNSQKVWFIVYDVDNKIYYELENNDSNPKKIHLVERNDVLLNSFYEYIFENYINDNCELLKEKGNVKISGERTFEVIYEVDLIQKKNKKCFFKNFIFLD